MLTSNFDFQPNELIRINGIIYAVYLDTNEELGDFPILAEVEFESFLKEGATIIDLSEEQFADKYGYVFRGHGDLYVSDIPTGGEQQEYRGVLDLMEAQLEKRAKTKGNEWLLDKDVQVKFLAAALTGKPLTEDDLSDTEWYKSSTPEQRSFIAEFYGDPAGVEEKLTNNIASINQALFDADFVGDTSGLATELAYGLTTSKYGVDEVNQYIGYLSDKFYLELSGGEQLLPEELRQYVGKFPTNDGKATAENYITSYLGKDAIQGYKNSGQFLQFAGMIRNGKGDVLKEDLQKVHDNLYPAFAGSQYSVWNPFFTNRASKIIYGTTGSQIVDLPVNDQVKVNQLIIDSKGDYNEFDKLVRKAYINSPGVKNDFLDDLARAIPQSFSGVFR